VAWFCSASCALAPQVLHTCAAQLNATRHNVLLVRFSRAEAAAAGLRAAQVGGWHPLAHCLTDDITTWRIVYLYMFNIIVIIILPVQPISLCWV
jgi:hypothetical protein